MNSDPVQLDQLWDADAYFAEGRMPWTLLSYPTRAADEHGLPTDDEALQFLAAFQQYGIKFGVWRSPFRANEIYIAAPGDNWRALMEEIQQMERRGEIDERFWTRFIERVWGQREMP